MKREDYQPLGKYIEQVDIRNRELHDLPLLGVSVEKILIPSVANINGTDMSNYKILGNKEFVYIADTSRRGDKIAFALNTTGDAALCSQAYTTFRIKDSNELMSEYLMMWAMRPEFDRYARYMSHGSVRELFSWEEMCNVLLPVPPISEQRRIVSEYQTVERRIANNERLIKKLEETAQAIYHHTFVEGIDENNLPEGWRKGKLGEVCEYNTSKIVSDDLNFGNYISTENILKDKQGVTSASSIPEDTKVTEYAKNDILISNIRPYFKKIWLATNDGGCSNDVLCIRCKENYDCHFVYNILFEDKFFDYVTASCQGTKMPRGDKEWIMNYTITIPSEEYMKQFITKVKTTQSYIENVRKETHHLRTLLSLLTSRIS